MGLKHSELVEIGYKWCMSRCAFAFKELVTLNSETPDVLGFNSSGTFLLEAKCSRGDFLADKKKHFRQYPFQGVGDWRFFICEKGLISIKDLPDFWGLIEVNENKKAKVSHNPFGKGNIYSSWEGFEKNEKAERAMMYSALRRLSKKGFINELNNETK